MKHPWRWVFGILIALTIGRIGNVLSSSNDIPAAKVESTAAPSPPKTPADMHGVYISTALQLCKEWTRKKSKLGVGEIVEEYEQTSKKPLPADNYRVGIDWRAEGAGLLMHSTCQYHLSDGGLNFMVSAESRPR